MNVPLYTIEILRLASSLPDPRLLEREDGKSNVRSQACGSHIEATVQLNDQKRVEQLSLKVHACAFGQASAALVQQHGRGRSRDEVAAALSGVEAWLAEVGTVGPGWPGIEALEPARKRKGRHDAILLPFRALLGAIEAAS
jgi:NifU-like protein involved in Fe-S cluster formation